MITGPVAVTIGADTYKDKSMVLIISIEVTNRLAYGQPVTGGGGLAT